jgi:hypothetical protein
MNTVNQIEANTGKLQIKEQIMKNLEEQFYADPTQENAIKWQNAEDDFNDALKEIDVPIFFENRIKTLV